MNTNSQNKRKRAVGERKRKAEPVQAGCRVGSWGVAFPLPLCEHLIAQQFVNKIIPFTKYFTGIKECSMSKEKQYLELIFVGKYVYFDGWS